MFNRKNILTFGLGLMLPVGLLIFTPGYSSAQRYRVNLPPRPQQPPALNNQVQSRISNGNINNQGGQRGGQGGFTGNNPFNQMAMNQIGGQGGFQSDFQGGQRGFGGGGFQNGGFQNRGGQGGGTIGGFTGNNPYYQMAMNQIGGQGGFQNGGFQNGGFQNGGFQNGGFQNGGFGL